MASVCREYLSHCGVGAVLTGKVTSSPLSLVVMVSSYYLLPVHSLELSDLQPLVFVSRFQYIVDSLFKTYCKVLAKETYVHCITFHFFPDA
jgi:UDP-N-acetylglucosamine transferase subunit ALG13